MAKRRRLSPARTPDAAPEAGVAVLERPAPHRAARAPIAEVAGDAAAAAALHELAGEVRAARAEGRLVEALPLDAVDAEHLMRDRMSASQEEMAALEASLRAHGQRMPIEVTPIEPEAGSEGGVSRAKRGGGPCYGLISGWRRLAALRRLHAETGEARFATVRALVRRPEGAAEAYVAMVEENEIRAQLSHYERARLVARAADAGVFAGEDAALRALFASGSAARRSKIKAFVALHRTVGDRLRHPAMIPERLGLGLARALREDPGLAARLGGRLDAAASAEDELALLREAAEGGAREEPRPAAARTRGRGRPRAERPAEVAPGVRLEERRGALVLSGPGVDAALRERLAGWLRGAA